MPHVVEPERVTAPPADETPIYTEMAKMYPSALGLKPTPITVDGAEEVKTVADLPPLPALFNSEVPE